MGNKKTHWPSFLVTIHDDDFTQELQIPIDFIKHFNGIVPVEFILRTSSSGRCWIIKVKRVEENLFLRKGWADFVEDHSLELGDSLVLQYIGNSQFSVKIYGKNGCEKDLRSSYDDIEKPINPGEKKEQELKSKEKSTKCHTDFEHRYYEGKCGRERDSVGYDKNKKFCGSGPCVEQAKRRMVVYNEGTGEPEEGCSYKEEHPYFISTWTKKNEYQMEIPKLFLREVGEELPDAVFLKDPGGTIWPIGLRKSDGRVWLQNGWKQFIEHQSLSDQHLLIFRYDGNSEFDFFIFNIRNKSAYEVKDLDEFRHHEEPNLDKRCQFNEENRNKSASGTESRYKNKRSTGSMSSSEERPNSRCKKKRSSGDQGKTKEGSDSNESNQAKQQSEESSPCEGNERNRASIHDEDKEESLETERQEEIKEEDYVECFDVDDSSSSIEVSAVTKKQAVYMRKKKKKKKASATQIASEFKSEHPFFTVNLRLSYVNHRYFRIPSTFDRKHLLEDIDKRMIRLEVSDGRAWFVKCHFSASNRNEIRISKGISTFLSSNNLVEGDACIFEAIKKNTDFMFKVHIFHCRRTPCD